MQRGRSSTPATGANAVPLGRNRFFRHRPPSPKPYRISSTPSENRFHSQVVTRIFDNQARRQQGMYSNNSSDPVSTTDNYKAHGQQEVDFQVCRTPSSTIIDNQARRQQDIQSKDIRAPGLTIVNNRARGQQGPYIGNQRPPDFGRPHDAPPPPRRLFTAVVTGEVSSRFLHIRFSENDETELSCRFPKALRNPDSSLTARVIHHPAERHACPTNSSFSPLLKIAPEQHAYHAAPPESVLHFRDFIIEEHNQQWGIVILDIVRIDLPEMRDVMGIIIIPEEAPKEQLTGLVQLGDIDRRDLPENYLRPRPFNAQKLIRAHRHLVKNNDFARVTIVDVKNSPDPAMAGQYIIIKMVLLNQDDLADLNNFATTKPEHYMRDFRLWASAHFSGVCYDAASSQREYGEQVVKNCPITFVTSQPTSDHLKGTLQAQVLLPSPLRFKGGEKVRIMRNHTSFTCQTMTTRVSQNKIQLILRMTPEQTIAVYNNPRIRLGEATGRWTVEKLFDDSSVRNVGTATRRAIQQFFNNPQPPHDTMWGRVLRAPGHGLERVLAPESQITQQEMDEGKYDFATQRSNQEQASLLKLAIQRLELLIAIGPPGTGKTVVVADLTATQAFKDEERNIKSKYLVTSKSNLAVDTLAVKLFEYQKKIGMQRLRVLRLYATMKQETASDECKEFSLHGLVQNPPPPPTDGTEDVFKELRNMKQTLADLESRYQALFDKWRAQLKDKDFSNAGKNALEAEMKTVRDAIATMKTALETEAMRAYDPNVICCTLGNLDDPRLKCMKYDTLVVDEAGHASELMVILALTKLASINTDQEGGERARGPAVILIGDDNQLRPMTTTTNQAAQFLQTTSLAVYGKTIKLPMLLEQYRMDPSISRMINEQVYDGQLRDGVTREERRMPDGFKFPSPDCSMLFDDMTGKEEVLPGGSIRNRSQAEAMLVYHKYFQQFEELRGSKGVIYMSPYEAQRQLILQTFSAAGVEIDSNRVQNIDSMQGREEELIIISMVRSQPADSLIKLGFCKDFRRTNVMVSRGRRGVIFLGNSSTLSETEHWACVVSHLRKMDVIRPNYYLSLAIPEATDPMEQHMGINGGMEPDSESALERSTVTSQCSLETGCSEFD